jgi:hypothetical protein
VNAEKSPKYTIVKKLFLLYYITGSVEVLPMFVGHGETSLAFM